MRLSHLETKAMRRFYIIKERKESREWCKHEKAMWMDKIGEGRGNMVNNTKKKLMNEWINFLCYLGVEIEKKKVGDFGGNMKKRI